MSRRRARALHALMLLVTIGLTACARTVTAPIVTAPQYPDFIFPALPVPDARQADVLARHEGAWRWLQAGDIARAEAEFHAVLKRSPGFYPSDTGLAYLDLARQQHDAAAARFQGVVEEQANYVPALVGLGEALLASARDAEALAAFERAAKLDPGLQAVARRVEVLRVRALQEAVAAARRAAVAGQLDEAARLYNRALEASPDSAFLVRDLAEVEAKQGKIDEALARFRRASELDAGDAVSRVRIGEILETRGDLDGAMQMYAEAEAIEPTPEIRRRQAALAAHIAYLELPAEYRAIPEQAVITRGDLASLLGIRLEPLLAQAAVRPVLITDVRMHWAVQWITAVAQSSVMEPYENHTFQPRTPLRRSDLTQAVARVLKLLAAGNPQLLKDWQSRLQKMSDVGVSNLHYADASLAVAAGILTLADGGAFELSRLVSGAEALDAVDRLERLYTTSK